METRGISRDEERRTEQSARFSEHLDADSQPARPARELLLLPSLRVMPANKARTRRGQRVGNDYVAQDATERNSIIRRREIRANRHETRGGRKHRRRDRRLLTLVESSCSYGSRDAGRGESARVRRARSGTVECGNSRGSRGRWTISGSIRSRNVCGRAHKCAREMDRSFSRRVLIHRENV